MFLGLYCAEESVLGPSGYGLEFHAVSLYPVTDEDVNILLYVIVCVWIVFLCAPGVSSARIVAVLVDLLSQALMEFLELYLNHLRNPSNKRICVFIVAL